MIKILLLILLVIVFIFILKNSNEYFSTVQLRCGLAGSGGIGTALGITFNLGEGQLFVEANYLHSLTNIVNEAARYQYPDLINTFYYLDDDISLSSISISLGYNLVLNYKVLNDK